MLTFASIDGVQIHPTVTYGIWSNPALRGLGGLPPKKRLLTARPRADGARDDTKFFDSRVVDWTGIVRGANLAAVHAAVDGLKALLLPGVDHTLVFQREGLAFQEQLTFREADMDVDWGPRRRSAVYSLSLIAGDPLIYSAIEHSQDSSSVVAGTRPSGPGIFLFVTYPAAGEAIVTNAGNTRSYPRIRVFGPGHGYTIRNETTQEQIAMSTLVLAAGEWAEVDMRAKTIVKSSGINLIAYLDQANSSFWGIDAGIHTLHLLVGSSMAAATKMTVYWRDARA